MSITSRRDIHYLLLRPATLVIIIRKCRDWLKVHQNDFSSEVRSKYIIYLLSRIPRPPNWTRAGCVAGADTPGLLPILLHSAGLGPAPGVQVSRYIYTISTQYLHNFYTISTLPAPIPMCSLHLLASWLLVLASILRRPRLLLPWLATQVDSEGGHHNQ